MGLEHKTSRGTYLIVTGFVCILMLFVMYSRFQNSEAIHPESLDVILRIAHMFYVLLILAFGSIGYGMYLYHKQKVGVGVKDGESEDNSSKLLTVIAKATWNKKSRKIFVIVFVVYGIFFSLASGTLVYQPQISFEYHYGVVVPSAFIAPCCDNPGYMPAIFVYITDHVGLQIIPINLVLQIIVSYLVGLNAALSVTVLSLSKKSGGISTVGATIGLFIACPTCAGTFLSLFVGTASGIAAVIVLTHLQTLFIALSIPILLVTPFIIAKKIRKVQFGDTCSVL